MNQGLFIERHLKARLDRLLGQGGFQWRLLGRPAGADFELRLKDQVMLGEVVLSRSSVHFDAAVRRLQELTARGGALPLLAAPSLSPRRQERLRELGICFLDLAGSAWMKAPGLLIDQRSREKGPRLREVNSPFSDKSSLLLRAMMERPERYWANHELAAEAGVSAPWASQISRRLEELGYAVRAQDRRLKLFRPQDVLEDWVEYYRQRKQAQHRFRLPASSAAEVLKAVGASQALRARKGLLSCQAGASLVAPHAAFREVHVYSQGLPAALDDWREELRLEEAAPGDCNLVLVDPYYAVSSSYGSRVIDGLPVVSDVQLFLDLRVYPLRGEEQARRLFDRRLAPKWGLEGAGV